MTWWERYPRLSRLTVATAALLVGAGQATIISAAGQRALALDAAAANNNNTHHHHHHHHHHWVGHDPQPPSIFFSLLLFLGMAADGIPLLLHRCSTKRRRSSPPRGTAINDTDTEPTDESQSLLAPSSSANPPPAVSLASPLLWLWISAPALTDLLATLLYLFGLARVQASTWAMLHGFSLVFSAVISRFCVANHGLKRHPRLWLAIGGALCGLLLIGLSALVSSEGKGRASAQTSTTATGIALVLGGALLAAVDGVFDELVQGRYPGLSPTMLTCGEGIVGSLATVAIVMPISQCIGLENSWHTLHLVRTDRTFCGLCVGMMCTITIYSVSLVSLAGKLSAVHRSLLSLARGFVVWLIELTIFYTSHASAGDYGIGERWSEYDFLQLGGWLVLVVAGCLYAYYLVRFEDEAKQAAAPADSQANQQGCV